MTDESRSIHRLKTERAEFGLHDLQLLVREPYPGAEIDRRHHAGLDVLGLFQFGNGAGPGRFLAATPDRGDQYFCCGVSTHGVAVDAFELGLRHQWLCLLEARLAGRACEWLDVVHSENAVAARSHHRKHRLVSYAQDVA